MNTVKQRFWSKVKKSRGCWNWTATLTKGYGHLRIGRKMKYAHRISWELHNGPIADGLSVLHKCDNTRCVNHKHLFLGTPNDNSKDMVLKGRGARGITSGMSKLTEAEIIDIRSRPLYWGIRADLGKEFNVSAPLISDIINRRIWRHI